MERPEGDASAAFGVYLRALRTAAGLTQRGLAEAVGMSVAAIRDLEQGRRRRPRRQAIDRIVAALALDSTQAQELYGRQQSPRPTSRDPLRLASEAGGLQISVLGPMTAGRPAAGPLSLGPPRQRAVLGLLALNPNELVHREQLIDALWPDEAPATALDLIQAYVSRLRRSLEPVPSPQGRRARLSAVGSSYRLRVDPDELDLLVFRRMAAKAMEVCASGDPTAACDGYQNAMEHWRGRPLADLDLLRRHPAVTALLSERAAVVLRYAEAAARGARHEQVVPHLWGLAEDEPLDERAHGQLMIALAASGRQGTALQVYENLRHRLDEQLGVRPGPELASVHLRVLHQDTRGEAPGDGAGGFSPGAGKSSTEVAGQAGVVPRQLPAAMRHFTGRAREIESLHACLDDAGAARAPVIVVIDGTAGVGKTALAVHWAHQVAGRFPDGQLYVNLRGYDPGQPVSAGDALAAFLRSLGVPGQDIPPEADERAPRYRSLLAGKRMLVILDNAGSADQVRPLLPGAPTCTVVVTSRDALAGLVARDGATRLNLDVLPLADAVALLQALIGARADAEPEAAVELAGQCCRLPLALRIAAELAASRPAAALAGLTGELTDQSTRLDLLTAGGDPRTGVRAVFSWSYRHLDAEDARTFRLLGLHPGPDVELYAAAALTGTTVTQARQALDVLARTHLIQPTAPGRYGMHDLLRGYACELSAAPEAGQEQHAALTRLFDHYLRAAAAAMDTLFPAERHRRPRIPRPTTLVPPLADPPAARDWLDAERAALVAVAAHTAAHDWPSHATRLAATLARYLLNGGHVPEAIAVFSHALGAARRTGDRTAEATALDVLGDVDWRQSRFQEATDQYGQALTLFRAVGDRAGEASALSGVGLAEINLGRYEQAARHHQETVAIYRNLGDRLGEARALGNVGWARQRQGHDQEAADYYQRALDLSREIGDHEGEAWTLARLGGIARRLGRYQRAAGYLQQALALFQELGSTVGEAEIRARLGDVYLGSGRYEQAVGNFERVLAMSRKIGDPGREADARNGLGDVLLRTGDVGRALAHHAAALRLASEAGLPRQQARAHSGLARACHADGDLVQARHHWQEALTRYDAIGAIGAPEARDIRAQLAGVGDDGDNGNTPTEDDCATKDPSPKDLSGHTAIQLRPVSRPPQTATLLPPPLRAEP